MKEVPKISDAEWKVMKVLWDQNPLTSTDIINRLKNDNSWSPKTVHTLIRRLVKKEAIGVNKDNTLNMYFPLVTMEECRNTETKSFLHKVYDGSLSLLIANFVEDKKLSPKEIEELKLILEKPQNEEG